MTALINCGVMALSCLTWSTKTAPSLEIILAMLSCRVVSSSAMGIDSGGGGLLSLSSTSFWQLRQIGWPWILTRCTGENDSRQIWQSCFLKLTLVSILYGYFYGLADRIVLHLEEVLILEAEYAGHNIGREHLDLIVVIADIAVKEAPGRGYLVFGVHQFLLEFQEILVGF